MVLGRVDCWSHLRPPRHFIIIQIISLTFLKWGRSLTGTGKLSEIGLCKPRCHLFSRPLMRIIYIWEVVIARRNREAIFFELFGGRVRHGDFATIRESDSPPSWKDYFSVHSSNISGNCQTALRFTNITQKTIINDGRRRQCDKAAEYATMIHAWKKTYLKYSE